MDEKKKKSSPLESNLGARPHRKASLPLQYISKFDENLVLFLLATMPVRCNRRKHYSHTQFSKALHPRPMPPDLAVARHTTMTSPATIRASPNLSIVYPGLIVDSPTFSCLAASSILSCLNHTRRTVGVLDQHPHQGGTRGGWLCDGGSCSGDLELEGKGRDTGHKITRNES
jgi:hypothetical protein